MKKKGSSLSMEVVIVGIIVLVVLIVIILFATGTFDSLFGTLTNQGGQAADLLNGTLISPK
jgi:hypothetical protein